MLLLLLVLRVCSTSIHWSAAAFDIAVRTLTGKVLSVKQLLPDDLVEVRDHASYARVGVGVRQGNAHSGITLSFHQHHHHQHHRAMQAR